MKSPSARPLCVPDPPRLHRAAQGSPGLGQPAQGSNCARLAPGQKQRQPDPQKVRLLSAGGVKPSLAPAREAGRTAASGGAVARSQQPFWSLLLPSALCGERLPGKDTCRRALRVTGSGCSGSSWP